ncbi:MAG: hypothetical protein ACR2PL_04515 [Dehalococcoidia bacterium]
MLSLGDQEARLVMLDERMRRTLGGHTVNVLIERAIWETSQRYPEAELLRPEAGPLSFDALKLAVAGRHEDTTQMLIGLYANIMKILGRLLGREMAQQLATAEATG